MKKNEYRVTGMTCPGCENSVKRVVTNINGVENVDAHFKMSRVVASYDEKVTNDDEIMNAIRKLGYEASIKE